MIEELIPTFNYGTAVQDTSRFSQTLLTFARYGKNDIQKATQLEATFRMVGRQKHNHQSITAQSVIVRLATAGRLANEYKLKMTEPRD